MQSDQTKRRQRVLTKLEQEDADERDRARRENERPNPITCVRCKEPFGFRSDGKCTNCHTHRDRLVGRLSGRRKSKIGGKRGRNSGKVNSKGKKG